MIRFPDIKLLNLTHAETKLLWSSAIDVFLNMKDSPLFETPRVETSPVAASYAIPEATQKEDILRYKDETISREEKQRDIISIMTEKTIFDYIGFEIISKNTPMFVNRFV